MSGWVGPLVEPLPCGRCQAEVPAGRVRLAVQPWRPLCATCVHHLGLTDVETIAEALDLLIRDEPCLPPAHMAALARLQPPAATWVLDRLTTALQLDGLEPDDDGDEPEVLDEDDEGKGASRS